jgi:hypothetical protein
VFSVAPLFPCKVQDSYGYANRFVVWPALIRVGTIDEQEWGDTRNSNVHEVCILGFTFFTLW